jgi:Fe-S-cluster containining protein
MTARKLRILRMPEADPGQRRLTGGLLGRADFAVAPCKGCDSRCCGLRAYMSIPEAVRMAFVLGIPLTFFIEVAIEGEDLELDERWGGALHVDGGRAQLSFLRDPETKVCRHVVRPGETTSHCGVYSLRPGICRLYPYAFEAPDGTEHAIGSQDRCPVFWMFDEPARAQLERDWEAWQADLAVDAAWVKAWNDPAREDRSVDALLRWLSHDVAVALGHYPEDLEPLPERAYTFRQITRRSSQKAADES